jgi:hypothetical protein
MKTTKARTTGRRGHLYMPHRRAMAVALGLALALCPGRAHAIVGHYTAGFPNVTFTFDPLIEKLAALAG